jgi:DNA helicase-4
LSGRVLDTVGLQIAPGVMWASVRFPMGKDKVITLDGIPNDDALCMIKCVQEAIDEIKRLQKKVRKLLKTLNISLQAAVKWANSTEQKCKDQLKAHGWVTSEFTASLEKSKPTTHLELIDQPEIAQQLTTQPENFQAAIRLWARDTADFTEEINECHVVKELDDSKKFFDGVEKSPLTEEQSRSVICFDTKVLLVASAGSGKTSTIVAKAGYALMKGYVQPEKILILTFNNAGAAELKLRVNDRLNKLNLPAEKIVVRTFHAFGLEAIGAVTGKKPSLAPWLDAGDDLRPLVEIIDSLKKDVQEFWINWEFFRLVLGQDLPAFGKEDEYPDYWNSESRNSGFLTANGETVKSRGEQVIANWLFLNGVKYQYEAAYKHDTADAQHRQYFPDFYFPDVDVYLEHWALDEDGNPPPEFTSYSDGIAWKREIHQTHGTKLLETTMAQLWSGQAFEYLERELKAHNVELKFDSDRPIQGRKPIEHKRMARTFRSFLTHFKSNRLTIDHLHDQLKLGRAGRFIFRHKLFIKLFEQIFHAWEAKLRAGKWVDFEDMLNRAADFIESGAWSNPYQMVLVDEFQDSSQARSRIVAALVKEPGRCLFAVGDDWQSINRFAGADLTVMTNFQSHFGQFTQLMLGTTFRCPQVLCDISSSFIRKNPNQISKSVTSVRNDVDQPVRIVQVREDRHIRHAVQLRIDDIQKECLEAGKKAASVFVIGRYQNDQNYSPSDGIHGGVSIKFLTVHSSKGFEADYVILPRVTNDFLGFPSKVADDRILQIAMPEGDGFELSEERRLFYVALTRAKHSVTIVTIENRISPFVHELIKDFGISVESPDGTVHSSIQCSCGNGFMVKKNGKYGEFWGCSNFPTCRETRQYLDVPTMGADAKLTQWPISCDPAG